MKIRPLPDFLLRAERKMQIYNNLESLSEIRGKTAVTIGKFDGLHLGHQMLLQKISEKKEEGLIPAVVSIEMNKNGGSMRNCLLTNREEEDILEAFGTEPLLRIPFTEEFAKTEAERFLTDILLQKLHAAYIVCGEDFRFGRDRKGSPAFLSANAEEFGFSCETVPSLTSADGSVISSTRIRTLLDLGQIADVEKLCGRPYEIRGTVINGMHLAGKLGFPTANIRPDPDKYLPCFGVYQIRTLLHGQWIRGLANLGTKPTVQESLDPLLEVYYPGISENLYGQQLGVFFEKFIRPEKKFESLDALKNQMKLDLQHLD